MKKQVFAALHQAGITRLAAWLNKDCVTMLCYHGVTERRERSPRDPHGIHIRRDRFAAQLDYLQRNYNVISLREYLTAKREGKKFPSYSVILTFDDGYRNFLTAALPELSARSLPVSLYLITARLRNAEDVPIERRWQEPDDTQYLSWAEALEIARSYGVEIGSHTCSHPKLNVIPFDAAKNELQESLNLVRNQTQNDEVTLAYPFGMRTNAVVDEARRAGYACALTTDGGPNDLEAHLYELKRTVIGDSDDEPAFAARVSHLAWWLTKLAHVGRRSTKNQTA